MKKLAVCLILLTEEVEVWGFLSALLSRSNIYILKSKLCFVFEFLVRIAVASDILTAEFPVRQQDHSYLRGHNHLF